MQLKERQLERDKTRGGERGVGYRELKIGVT
jgi:hypothetical protein